MAAPKGAFVREASMFRHWISRHRDAPFAADRYHLYVSLACPWASRCLATMYMKGLDATVGLSVVHPVFQRTRPGDDSDLHAGWAFVDPTVTPTLAGPSGIGSYSSRGATLDVVNNAAFVRDLYELCSPEKTRYSVPVLWDKQHRTIVSNDSADIVRMLNAEFSDVAPSPFDLYPEAHRAAIDELNEWIHRDICNGVYKCGFATTQEAYDEAVAELFAGLERVEAILARQRYLVGDVFTEADLRLFTTLVRFDEVYYVHFKTNKKLIQQYANLSNYVRDIYQLAPVKRSVDMEHIRLHYYASHTLMKLNLLGIVPVGPGVDFDAPHDRARFASAKVPWPVRLTSTSRERERERERARVRTYRGAGTGSDTFALSTPVESKQASERAMVAERSPAKAASDAEKLPVAAQSASASEQSASDAEPASDDDNDGNDDDNERNVDNDNDIESIGNDDNGDDEEELDAVGFGDAMSKILGQSVAGDAQPILAKRTTARMREILADKKGSKTARVSAAEKREKEQKDMVVPDHSTAVLDRRLRGIATKGVVALFNAIEKHQHQSGKKTDEKSDKKVKEMSKDNFLGLLKASQKATSEPTAAAASKTAWSVVQDDYMMGAKLKDWDAAHGTEKGRVRTEDDAETEAAEDAAWKQVGDLDSDDGGANAAASKRKSAKKASTKKPTAAKKARRS
ncbi:hypothetical protein PybrP1_006673 [[Pythium] brassicae (nom. inval.)]|nr:hypothetical protein PybrP1_006673 [[Pythium] brassicae (nom. inval.)]